MTQTITNWDEFTDRCEKLCARHLPVDGYSLEWLHAQWMANKRPLDVLYAVLWRKHGLHR